MNYLHALTEFARAIDEPNSTNTTISSATQANMTVYRNNIRLNRANALKLAYPTVLALLGEEFFMAMADVYTHSTASTSANLHQEGHLLAEFIAQFEPTQAYPYLSDVAQLDWAMHQAHYADDHAGVSTAILAEQLQSLAQLKLQLHPALHVIESQWPIASLFAMHHGGEKPQDLYHGECVLVWRDQYQIIDAAQAAFFLALMQQLTFEDALLAGAAVDAAFDPASSLSLLLEQQLIIALA
ncbi:DNA-binding domain-containing protein [uncultured Deefgea sp.]|uniref:HvfC/BufC N-terminal domain-containing protein n=1 Tax=uncultured Deefgea sp. TaxID=1304914 RepID=UPI002594BBE3|nr:DNA-binding domain-containing protein [uncultured Deefgea sp.]